MATVLYWLLRRDPAALPFLTLGVAASIVHLRALKAQVSRMDPRLGIRAGSALWFLLRYLVLGGVLLALLRLGFGHPWAFVIGLASLPFALLAEAAVQVLTPALRRESP
jgi:hypothetical protein